jgi:hypothetical protein
MGPRSAWIRQNGLFKQISEFNWEEFDNNGKAKMTRKEDVPELLCDNFTGLISKKTAAEWLATKIGKGLSTMYRWIDELTSSKQLQESPDGHLILT